MDAIFAEGDNRTTSLGEECHEYRECQSSVAMLSPSPVLALGAFLLLTIVDHSSQLVQMCGGGTNASVFHVVSPGYPFSYPAGLRCEVAVYAASASMCSLELNLGSLNLPCPSDRLTVADKPLCGVSVTQEPFHWPETLITFRGSIEGGDGFNITVRQIECENSKKNTWCGGELSGETIQILSPGYPSSYPGGLDCGYTIRATDPEVCQVEVRLQNSVLEESINCTKDSLKINEDSFCGNLNGVRTYNINKQLNITFRTDLEGNSKGFNLTTRQIRCVDVDPVAMNENLASDKQDTPFECDPGIYSTVSRDGYADFTSQYHPFLSRPIDNPISVPYFTQYYNQGSQRVPSEYPSNRVPPYRQYSSTNPFYSTSYQPNSVQFQSHPVQSYASTAYRPPIYQNPSFVSSYQQHSSYIPNVNSRPYTPVSNNYWLIQSDVRQTTSRYQQCCSQVYTESHFLLVSPGFPRSTTTDCIYTITRYSTLTYQIRFQFRYFWAGEDLGSGCSGGYLEIDGTKVCGCKTGRSWTSQFTQSETSKTLHLKLDTQFNRLFNGFVLEVYQDDSYSQRYSRATDADFEPTVNATEPTGVRVANFSQFVETFVEREPVLSTNDGYPLLDRDSAQPTWKDSRQSGTLNADWFCLRWNFQDWLVLAREVLWAKYQCPTSSSSSSSSTRADMTQLDHCRTCLYLCRQNCQCCQ